MAFIPLPITLHWPVLILPNAEGLYLNEPPRQPCHSQGQPGDSGWEVPGGRLGRERIKGSSKALIVLDLNVVG